MLTAFVAATALLGPTTVGVAAAEPSHRTAPKTAVAGVTGDAKPTPKAPGVHPATPLRTPDATPPAVKASENAAAARAKATGKPVVVDALTTEDGETVANPNGTFQLTEHARPTHVRRGDQWVPVDATLRRNPDGTLSPTASAGGLTFSGGGSAQPLARLDEDGRSIALTWPSELPTPRVEGNTATYENVLPDVALIVIADVDGFAEQLIVRSRKAAANPGLKAIKFGLKTTGLTVRKSADGGLSAVDATNNPVITAPAPNMWDSALAPNPAGHGTEAPPSNIRHHAGISIKVDSGRLTLTPDQAFINDPATSYPVTIDPYFGGRRQHWTMADSQWPTTSFWDGANWRFQQPAEPRVGHIDDPQYGSETVRSFFQMDTRGIAGKHVLAAEFNTFNSYSATCRAEPVELWWTGAINAGVTWRHQPRFLHIVRAANESHGHRGCQPATIGFEMRDFAQSVASGRWPNATLALKAPNEGDVAEWKRFHSDPTFEVTYNSTPDVPDDPRGVDPEVPCVTSGDAPWIGKTAALTPPSLAARQSDPDGGSVTAIFHYWIDGTDVGAWPRVTVNSGSLAQVRIDPAFMANVADGQTIDWQTQTTDGVDTSAGTDTCRFKVKLTAPDAPSIMSSDGRYPPASKGTGGRPDTPGTFTITNAGTSPAVRFVYGLGQDPPPPSSAIDVVNGRASVSFTPVSPGPHTLFAYALDVAGNASAIASYTFRVDSDPATTYDSLAAAFNNTAVTDDSNTGAGAADGNYSFSAQDMARAGWQPGGQVTVDGARFALPDFSGGKADNALAANQTINAHNARGDSMMLLATSTNAFNSLPADLASASVTTPHVPPGTNVAGGNCESMVNGRYYGCSAATGHLHYTDGSDQTYELDAPDWVSGPETFAAVTLTRRNTRPGAVDNGPHAPKLYAFAVPITPGKTVASVTLPDVGIGVSPTDPVPALHIFSMAVRDVATASAHDGAWARAWAGTTNGVYEDGQSAWNALTIRNTVRSTVSGNAVRVRLENTYSQDPVTLGHVTIAPQASGSTAATTPATLTFGRSSTVTIPAGAEVYSDPLPFPVSADANVLLSIYLPGTAQYLSSHPSGEDQQYVTDQGAGDHTADTSSGGFHAQCQCSTVATGLDVLTAPGTGTVAFVGGTRTNGVAASAEYGIDNALATLLNHGPSDQARHGVIDTALYAGATANDQPAPSTLSRLDRDLLSVPNLRTVIVWPDVDDAGYASLDDLAHGAYEPLAHELAAHGVNVIMATITPCHGFQGCGVDQQRMDVNNWIRLSHVPDVSATLDFDGVVAVPVPGDKSTPPLEQLGNTAPQNDFDSGDHIDLSADGYLALAKAIDPSTL